MTPVAIVIPTVTAATQIAGPEGAAPTGGVFAAFFAAIADGPAGGGADPVDMSNSSGNANVLTVLPSPSLGSAPTAPVDRHAPAAPKNGEHGDEETAAESAPLLPAPLLPAPLLPAPLLPLAPATANDAASPVAAIAPAPIAPPPTVPPPATPAIEPTTTHAPSQASLQAEAGGNSPLAEPASVAAPPVSAPTAQSVPIAPALPPPTSTQVERPTQTALPAQVAPPARSAHTMSPDVNSGSAPAADERVADVETPQLQPATQVKKPVLNGTDAKSAAPETKPASPIQTVAAGGNSGSVFIASVTPDAAMPLPIIDASAPVKTVPLSNLANLPNGAAVTAIGAVIASEASAGTNRFIIRLDPPELGRIDVRLRFGRDGDVHARLIADRPETASLLIRDAAVLERALNTAGMRTDSGVDVMLRDSSGGFARNDGAAGEAPAAPAYRPAIAADSLPDAPAWIRPASAGRLDLTV